jgi:hypothetical protein
METILIKETVKLMMREMVAMTMVEMMKKMEKIVLTMVEMMKKMMMMEV